MNNDKYPSQTSFPPDGHSPTIPHIVSRQEWNLHRRCDGQEAQGSQLLWVDYQCGILQGLPSARTKHTLIRTRGHQLRRETKLQMKGFYDQVPTSLMQPPHDAAP